MSGEQSQSVVDFEIDNSNNMTNKLENLYNDPKLSDICLLVGGQQFYAHKLILCLSSEVFEVMLMNPRWDEFRQSTVQLQETYECYQVFGQFLQYLYTSKIVVNHITVMPFLMLADKYNVKDLVKSCVKYMCKNIAHAALNKSLISWLQNTLRSGHYEVTKACEEFVRWNFEWVSKETDFLNIDIQILERILQRSDLVVWDEITVYKIVMHWLENQKKNLITKELETDSTMNELIQRLMRHIRFPMMTPRQLAELLLSPLTMNLKEFFIQRMAMGMSYHSNVKENLEEAFKSDDEWERLQFTPRLYTADKWCSLLTVEKYLDLQSYFVHTLMFSNQATIAEHEGDKTCDWVIDLYPKGIWFRKFFLIVWQGTVEVPEMVMRTVRVTVTCRDPPLGGLKVKVGLLIKGEQDGLEHIRAVMHCTHRFDEGDNVINLDDILSFDDLNCFCTGENPNSSPFLVGPNKDILKINVVIVPLNDLSVSDNDSVPIQEWMC